VKTTFLSKSEGFFVSSLRILMAYGKGEAQEKHNKSTLQSGVWGFHDKHRGMSMMKSLTFIMGCGLVVILRNGERNKLTRHPKDCGKDNLNSMANSLHLGEDDVDRIAYLTFQSFILIRFICLSFTWFSFSFQFRIIYVFF
jgi:hypothetical protein